VGKVPVFVEQSVAVDERLRSYRLTNVTNCCTCFL
jgi:hypothetical protein